MPKPSAKPAASPSSTSVAMIAKKVELVTTLPKNVKISGAVTRLLDAKGKPIKGATVKISSSGKVTIAFPKGSKVGSYTVKVTTKSKKVINLPIKLKK